MSEDRMRVGVVLSAGGVRGAAHVGVLRRLVEAGVPIEVLVGVSAGAVIAAYYAAVGVSLDDLVEDAAAFRGRHLLMHSLNLHLGRQFAAALEPRCGVIPGRLRQLETASFDRLHHGIRGLGIGCHDVLARAPRYFCTGADYGLALHDIVKASASIPVLFPKVAVAHGGERWLLTDGGISDPVPVAFARRQPLGATHVIVSDCRWIGRTQATDEHTIWIRPPMPAVGTLWTRRGLAAAVQQGEAAVTDEVVARVRRWGRR